MECPVYSDNHTNEKNVVVIHHPDDPSDVVPVQSLPALPDSYYQGFSKGCFPIGVDCLHQAVLYWPVDSHSI